MPLDAQVHFRVVVGRGVGIVLPRERKNHAGIFFPHWWQCVAAIAAGDFDARPLAPEIDSGRGFDHFVDVGSADARGTFEKIEVAVGMCLDKLRVRDSAHQA